MSDSKFDQTLTHDDVLEPATCKVGNDCVNDELEELEGDELEELEELEDV